MGEINQDDGIRGCRTYVSKIHLHVKQFSQKTNWKLAETPVHSRLRSTHYWVGREEKQSGWDLCPSNQVGTCAPERGLRGKGDYTGGDPPGERVVRAIGWYPSPGVLHRGDELVWLVGGLLGITGGLWKPGLCSWGEHVCWLAPEAGQKGPREDLSSSCQASHASACT